MRHSFTFTDMKIAAVVASVVISALSTTRASALVIDPTFDSSITSSSNAGAIESAINSAINTIDGLYSNVVTVPVLFTYEPGPVGNLESNTDVFYHVSYSTYVNLLQADAAAHPQNTVLATALANLMFGNNASGSAVMSITGNQLDMLTGTTSYPANSHVNINSNQPFGFSQPVSSSVYDAVGGIEHELDEVLGGGGGGSTLNNCMTNPGFFCGTYGPLDLYRYSAVSTPSFTTSSTASSYFSIDGGLTNIVDFNQQSGGDYADFAPACGGGSPSGPGQLIQNAFNCTGPDEPYTFLSPEFIMEEAIGWDPTPVPEPGSLALLGISALGLVLLTRRTKAERVDGECSG
jgi:hypothetical protein